MTFFNTKEEVLNIELTPYGKYVLSVGKFKPSYYEFYDDDVIYDSLYANYPEGQEETQQRINETPRTKVQYSFEGAEKRYKEYRKKRNEITEEARKLSIDTIEVRKNFSLTSLPLAKSSLLTEFVPSWSISILKGQIESISNNTNIVGMPNDTYVLNMANTKYVLTASIRDSDEPVQLEDNSIVGGSSDLNLLHKTFEDNTYIQVFEDFLLLHIKEENVEMTNENFDMIIYEIEIDPETQEEIEKPLLFSKEKQRVVNNILIDDVQEEIETYSGFEYANHYFNVYVDKEINTEILGRYLSNEEKKTLEAIDGYIFSEENIVDTQVKPTPRIPSITSGQINSFEDCE
jgi:hypothetical protein